MLYVHELLKQVFRFRISAFLVGESAFRNERSNTSRTGPYYYTCLDDTPYMERCYWYDEGHAADTETRVTLSLYILLNTVDVPDLILENRLYLSQRKH